MDLSIIIVNYNVYDDVIKCINSIYKHNKALSFEIIVVDNNSPDKSILNIKEIFPEIKFINVNSNNGFGYANNIAMKKASGDYFLLVNPDIIFIDNAVEKMINFLKNNKIAGACGPVQIKPNEGFEYYYTFFPSLYSRITQEFGCYTKAPLMKYRFYKFLNDNINHGKPFKVDWIIGSCLMFRKEIYDVIGGFDEAFFLYEEETEWQYRMKKHGWVSMMLPMINVIHNHHSSASKLGIMFVHYHEYRSRIIFAAKQYGYPLILIRKLLIIASIFFRLFYFTIFNYKSSQISKKRGFLYLDLLKLTLMPAKKLLASRFYFNNYTDYFLNTDNARF